MKRFFISILFFIVLCSVSLGQRTRLTPDLVIEGGYLNQNLDNLFPEKIDGEVKYEISKNDLLKNISTFIFLNKHEIIIGKDDGFIFFCKKIPVGSDLLTTPVGEFTRSRSYVSFMVSIDISDDSFKYEISDIQTERRVVRVSQKYLALATSEDFETLKSLDFRIETITVAGIDLPTKGDLSVVHRKRVAGMIAERNGYVNLCIKEGKTVRGLKSKWVENINKMDVRISSEISLYEDEYNSVLRTVEEMNKKISEN